MITGLGPERSGRLFKFNCRSCFFCQSKEFMQHDQECVGRGGRWQARSCYEGAIERALVGGVPKNMTLKYAC